MRPTSPDASSAIEAAIQSATFQTALDCIVVMDRAGRILEFNPAAERTFGYTRAEAIGKDLGELIVPPSLRETHRRGLERYLAEGRTAFVGRRVETMAMRKAGQEFPVELTITVTKENDGPVFIGFLRDLTESKRTEQALETSRQKLDALVHSVNGIVWEADAWTFQFTFVSRQAEALLGYSIQEWLEPDFWRKHVHPEDLARAEEWCIRARNEHRDHEFEYRLVARDGKSVWLTDKVSVHLENGHPVTLRGVMVDISVLKNAEQHLRSSAHRHMKQRDAIANLIRSPILQTDDLCAALRELTEISSRTLGVERVSVWRFNQARDSLVCSDLFEASAARHSSGTELRKSVFPTYFRTLSEIDVLAASDAHQDPRTREFSATYLNPLGIESMLDAPVQVEGVLAGVVCHEQVGEKRQWTADEESFVLSIANIVSLMISGEERRRLGEQLRQAQKMEAIGQLAGGVAHDFNNILAAIMMQAELAAGHHDLPADVAEYLDEVKISAERAANLTRQLLAFSRRQMMQRRVLDLNEAVAGLVRMLQRILGEDVRMQLNLHPTPLMTLADPGMLDQVLMNLAINARDAMPAGGRLLIETSERFFSEEDATRQELVAGRFVVLSVSDTGHGIAPENLPRIFEPFFTTKGPGKGTGLGLATVYGIVKQHRGAIQVYSEPGQGAVFRILIPAAPLSQEPHLQSKNAQPLPRGTETILVVEDDPSVRLLTRAVLERHGYNVLVASNGVEALRLSHLPPHKIDLLLTDMVMPEGINGRELARRLHEREPSLKVIFTSGYSAEIASGELTLEEGRNFLQKPASPKQILETVRRCLDAR